jgi:serine/threonine protein kinase
MDLLKKRKRLSEPEARFYMSQMLDAIKFMHARRVIHRDLKLGNFFLTSQMDLKIGDFGLATSLRHDGERKKCVISLFCILTSAGQFVERQITLLPRFCLINRMATAMRSTCGLLALFCNLFVCRFDSDARYTLLIGRPPFQTKEIKAIYRCVLLVHSTLHL